MVRSWKFWHGEMTVNRVFEMSNDFFQGNAVGICTAASLAWCRANLKYGRVDSFDDIRVSKHILNVQMSTLRKFDADPAGQTAMADLFMVRERVLSSVDAILQMVKTTHPNVGIFWTRGHTMGYRYSHHEKEFFDVEQGLFRAKYTAAIKAKIEETYGVGKPDGPVQGCRVVQLPLR